VSDPFAVAGEVRLKPGRDVSLRRRHPWIYRGALAGELPASAGLVRVLGADGEALATALVGGSGGSLALRAVAFGDEPFDVGVLRSRLRAAAELRAALRLDSDGYRLVHAEGDELPGLIIDRYGVVAVIEMYEPAWQAWLPALAEALLAEHGCSSVLARAAWRRKEEPQLVAGPRPDDVVVISEGPVRFPVDLFGGQKTGFFLDQRDNRRRVAELAAGRSVLNLFSYSGGFAIAALVAGARSALNVEASAAALELAREGYRLNGLALDEAGFVAGDAFEVTRQLLADGTRFELVVVDPPAFVKNKAALATGMRGYKDINLQAFKLAAPGALILTCSCSALVDEQSFGQALFAAALDAGRQVTILERRGAAPDHPVSIYCPEPRHLKAWLCRVN
jgi:23S rRNA (cytosine1962-C5)-methyltransferase